MKKIFFVIISLHLLFSYSAVVACTFCQPVKDPIEDAEEEIDDDHEDTFEDSIEDYYNSDLLPLIRENEALQLELTKLSAHIELMEREAVIDEEKLVFLIRKALKKNISNQGDKL
jgi:hypothetical protein